MSCLNRALSASTKEWFTFPRETEGNTYTVNWSLVEDGLVSKGNAFRNARIATLTTRLPKKVESGKVTLDAPIYISDYNVLESGDSISVEDFAMRKGVGQCSLSAGNDLFVEDGGLGALAAARTGVRVVSDNAALALIFRTLLISTPAREVDHRSRYDGWNLEGRWFTDDMVWNGVQYRKEVAPTEAERGQRPVLAIVGGEGADISVEFVENQSKIVGGTVVAGRTAPVRGLVEALGLASCVLMNERAPEVLALPSLCVSKGKETILIIGADDAITEAVLAKGNLYGAYHNVIIPGVGVSALWGGVIAPSASLTSTSVVPSVIVGNKTAVKSDPNNLVFPVTEFIFVEKGSTKITKEEAIKKLVDLTDETKARVAEAVLKGAKVSAVSTVKAVLAKL
eukprot:CAMPEP_0182428482 /NCGR_PEP_ID=MMETSP1167-20130531/23056_1 /TAXON_ID=2988 /ORGANISM="Mallomonas Sp, Strain CCMP3275" /LENGTH=396 /DNA_ID=CAMNT_0024611417 /DNA_START=101 /DNA_END=1291 /DNA_ORIENTATION=+